MDTNRQNILQNLLTYDLPLSVLKEQLSTLTWDWGGIQVDCKAEHLRDLLQRFIDQTLSAIEVEDWANLVECRDDIQFQVNASCDIEAIVHELANPILMGVLSKDRALKHMENLLIEEG